MPDVITQTELLSLRKEVEMWFTDVCDIQTASKTDDAYGGESTSLVPKATGVACEVYGGVAQDIRELFTGVVISEEMFTVTLPSGTDVIVGDHINLTSQTLHIRVTAVVGPDSHELQTRAVGVIT